jgi:hypothetical protein
MAKSIKAQFAENLKNGESNGNAKLRILCDAVAAYMETPDWTNLAWGIFYCANERDRKRMSAIIEAVTGLTFKADAKQPTGLRAVKSKASAETNKFGLLQSYYESGVSFRSDALLNDDGLPALLSESGSGPKLRTVEEIVLAAVRKARRDQPELATNVRLIAALNSALAAD